MKYIKKMMTAMLVAVMALALGSALAFAEDPAYSITVTNTNDSVSIAGKEYSAYKVFDMTNSGTAYAYSIDSDGDGAWVWNVITKDITAAQDGTYTNSTYGIKLTPTAADATVYAVTPLDTGGIDAAKARALADELAKVLPSTANGSNTVAAGAETTTIALEEAGYYAVFGKADPKDQVQGEVVAALALDSTNPTPTINPKVGVPTLNKKITGQHVLDEAGKAATAQVGTTVSFQLDSVVPDLTGYSDYTFTISDTMTSGLTFTSPSDVVVTINDADKTSASTVNVSGQTLTVTIPYNVLKTAEKGQAIKVTYSATVNSGALTTDYEKNTASLTYSNNPTTNTTNKTPDKEVYVIDVDINVDKVANEATGDKLSGAKFKVFKGNSAPADNAAAWYKWDSANNVVTWVAKSEADEFTTNAEGKFQPAVRGLEAEKTGTAYGLLETEAPTGYNLLSSPVIVTLTGAYTEGSTDKTATVTASGATVTNGTVTLTADQNSNQPVATSQVINKSGTELPSTGGMGTTILYVAGGIMVLLAGVYLITKRRASKEEEL